MEEAYELLNETCSHKNIIFNNTMWIFLWPTHIKNGELVISNVDCNWNVLDVHRSLEITANIILNRLGDKTVLHEPLAGHDMTVLEVCTDQVRRLSWYFPTLCKIIHLCNYLHFVEKYISWLLLGRQPPN